MSVVRLRLIRHGETDWNRALRFQGQIDVPLNAIGLEQARRLGRRLAALHRGQPSSVAVVPPLHCSDLQRARQTATPITWLEHAEDPGQQLNDPAHDPAVPILFATAWREQHFGVFEGKTAADNEREYPDLWASWRQFRADFKLPGGESTREFHDRVITALMQVCRTSDQSELTLVTHGGVLDMVWRHARGESLDGPRRCEIPNAGLNQVRFEAGRFHIESWGDVEHLSGMPPQPVYRTTDAALPSFKTS